MPRGAALAGTTTTGTSTRSANATPRGSSGNSASATAIGTITNDDTAAVDTDPPSVTVTSDAQEPVRSGQNGYINSNRFDVTVTFSEPVSDFDLSDLEVTNSSAESISPSSDGTQYTVTIDPIHTGEVTVKVPAGVATDAADNPNTASATFDIWAFGLSNSGAPSVTLRCGQRFTPTSFNVNLGFNRPIWGFDSDDVEITGATGFSALRLSGADATGRGLLWGSFSAGFDPSPGPGQMTVQVPAGAVRDRAGTSGQVVTNTASNTLRVALNRNASVADASATEGTDATMDFEVTLDTIDDCVTVTVEWTTEDGTATAGEDYSAASGTLTFGPGETAKTVSVVILDDSLVDNGETITLRLSNSSGASIADAEATGTITDDEATVDGNTAPTGLPEISGTAHVGETLTASASGIADADGLTNGTYAWQWIANDGASDADIADATGTAYTLTAAEAGKTIKVRVTFTDDGGTEETLVSEATVAVNAPTGLPAISGTARVGETLTASSAGISDGDGLTNASYAWQWIANDGNVGCRHRGRDGCDLHADGRRGGQDDQGTGDVHRRRGHRGDAGQRCDGGSGGEQCADGPSGDFRHEVTRGRDADSVVCRNF